MAKELELNKNNFEKEVLQSDKTVLIDFWAAWCGPCKMIAPTIEEIADEYSDKIKICKCDVDSNQELANQYEIRSIPTIVIIKDGKEVNRSLGAAPKERIINLFKSFI